LRNTTVVGRPAKTSLLPGGALDFKPISAVGSELEERGPNLLRG
jgi:hypothetical protein